MSEPDNGTQAAFSEAETGTLRILAGMIIPASAAHGLPGADEPTIFADIVASAGGRRQTVGEALAALDALAQEDGGADFAALEAAARDSVAEAFRHGKRAQAELLAMLVVQCYYRDDRVMRTLGMAARPPFPKGYEVPEGDWSLLDPVRDRAPFYRKAPD